MPVTTVEGVVRNGKVIISDEFKLPEDARVYVVVPDPSGPRRIMSPRLANKADASRLRKTIEDDFEDEV